MTANGADSTRAAAAVSAWIDARAAPERVRELAEACVRFVERALGVKLDYDARDALASLDHYLDDGAARSAAAKPEARGAGRPRGGRVLRRGRAAALPVVVARRGRRPERVARRARGGLPLVQPGRSSSPTRCSRRTHPAPPSGEAARAASRSTTTIATAVRRPPRRAARPCPERRVLRAVDAARGHRHRGRGHPGAPARGRRATRSGASRPTTTRPEPRETATGAGGSAHA